MSKYDNAREQIRKLLTANNDLANPRLFTGLLKIIDGLEAEEKWLPFDPDNIPEAKEGWCLLIDCKAGRPILFDYLNEDWANDWFSNDFDTPKTLKLSKDCTYKLVPLT